MIMLVLSLFFFVITIILEIVLLITRKDNKLKLNKDIKENPKISVIIPARYEASVIEGLLCSLERQSYSINKKDVYVIVENISDETVNIVKKHGMSYFVRKELDKKTKGYAIDELVKYLCQNNNYYDLYFIFDADNVLDEDFILNMLSDYYKGYYVSTGFRGLKNSESYISLCAWLTFSILNDSHNSKVKKNNGNLIFSGTGYYIEGSIIKDFKCFPFHSLTEDYESSLYYAKEGISTSYNKEAIFYDEQPTTYKVSIKQRSRWVKGYFSNYFKYKKKLFSKLKSNVNNKGSLIEMLFGVMPLITFIISLVLVLVRSLIKSIGLFCLELLVIYICLILYTIVIIFKNRKYIKSSFKVIVKATLYHPIFLISYIHAFLIALFNRNLGWVKIEHSHNDN